MSAPVQLAAPAKLNLFLNVRGRRDDGYHEVVTIMHTLALADQLTMALVDDGGPDRLVSSGPIAMDTVPGERNLVLLAIERYRHALPDEASLPGVFVTLEKNIPMQAGLGGGSSDAASTLLGLNRLCATPLPDEALMTLAGQLGADVAFFVSCLLHHHSAAVGWGRGEVIEPMPEIALDWPVWLVKPRDYGSPTAMAYARLAMRDRYRQLDPDPIIGRFARPGLDLETAQGLFYNDFEPVLFSEADSPLAALRRRLVWAGHPRPLLCGSGAAMAVFEPMEATECHDLWAAATRLGRP